MELYLRGRYAYSIYSIVFCTAYLGNSEIVSVVSKKAVDPIPQKVQSNFITHNCIKCSSRIYKLSGRRS